MHVHFKFFMHMCICIYTYIILYISSCLCIVVYMYVCVDDLEATEELTASETRAPSGRTVPLSDMPSITAPPIALRQQMERKREGRERGVERMGGS